VQEDYAACLQGLHQAFLKHGCRIHAYVLMTPQSRESISSALRFTGRYYVSYLNRLFGRRKRVLTPYPALSQYG